MSVVKVRGKRNSNMNESMGEQNETRRSKAVTYGDVFEVMGEVATKAIAPRDAAILQSAENMVIGMPQKDGPAAIMRSAAEHNVKHGFVDDDHVTDIVQKEGVTLVEAEAGGGHFVTEAVAGQVLGRCSGPVTGSSDTPISIGEALEAATLSAAGERPIVKSDAAAIEAAEMQATGKARAIPGRLAEEAYYSAKTNLLAERDEDKITIRDVLVDATKKIPNDKPASRGVAEAVIVAEVKHNPEFKTQPGGIVSSIAGAARLNEKK